MSRFDYYNENDPFAVQWLRNLINAKLIPPGVVDDRSILDVRPIDLKEFKQCHFFAGIAGWALALQLSDWPIDRQVWTGSCPCQPFSAAGKNGGFADERHLWPYWFHLIEQQRPATIFGEQVASKASLAWLDLVRSDLEAAGYACGISDLGAACVGAPHIRQRLWFVADAKGERRGWRPDEQNEGRRECSFADRSPWRNLEWLPCTDGKARPTQPGLFPLAHGIPGRVGRLRAYGNAIVPQVAAEFIKTFLEYRP